MQYQDSTKYHRYGLNASTARLNLCPDVEARAKLSRAIAVLPRVVTGPAGWLLGGAENARRKIADLYLRAGVEPILDHDWAPMSLSSAIAAVR